MTQKEFNKLKEGYYWTKVKPEWSPQIIEIYFSPPSNENIFTLFGHNDYISSLFFKYYPNIEVIQKIEEPKPIKNELDLLYPAKIKKMGKDLCVCNVKIGKKDMPILISTKNLKSLGLKNGSNFMLKIDWNAAVGKKEEPKSKKKEKLILFIGCRNENSMDIVVII